jgi:hypothetical protein
MYDEGWEKNILSLSVVSQQLLQNPRAPLPDGNDVRVAKRLSHMLRRVCLLAQMSWHDGR